MNHQLNPDMARQGAGLSGRIDAKGKYKGVIKHAKISTSYAGSEWVELLFKSDGGQEARISICIRSKDGEQTFGTKKLHAVMACCKVRSLTESEQLVREYDFDLKTTVEVMRPAFAELKDKKIGFVLYRHDQTSKKGKDFFAMELAAPFDYETEQTAVEVLDQRPATSLPGIVQSIKDKDSRDSNMFSAPTMAESGASPFLSSDPEPCNNFDDDIPF